MQHVGDAQRAGLDGPSFDRRPPNIIISPILQEAQPDHDRLGTGLMFTRNTQSSRRDSRTASLPTNDLIRDSGSLEMSEIGLRMIFPLY